MGAHTIGVLGCLLCVTGVSPTQGSQLPSRGEWDFNLQKEWEIARVQGEPLARIGELMVLGGGRLHVRDFTNNASYLFEESGQLIASLGRHGDQPGELSRYINRFAAGDKLVLGAPDALHFFAEDGSFVRTFPNNLFESFPLLFLDETSFIYARLKAGSPEGQAKLMRVDLASGGEKVLYDFTEPATGEAAPE